MRKVELQIGQKHLHPPQFVDAALAAIGHNTGSMSPLVPMAVDPAQRQQVEWMLHDGAWQMVNNKDDAIKAKWFQFAKTVQKVLVASRRMHNGNAGRAAKQAGAR